jgi:hypothetical protein
MSKLAVHLLAYKQNIVLFSKFTSKASASKLIFFKIQNDNKAYLNKDVVVAIATRKCKLNSKVTQRNCKEPFIESFEIETFQEVS